MGETSTAWDHMCIEQVVSGYLLDGVALRNGRSMGGSFIARDAASNGIFRTNAGVMRGVGYRGTQLQGLCRATHEQTSIHQHGALVFGASKVHRCRC